MEIIFLLNSLLLPSAVGVLIIRMLLPRKFPWAMIWMMGCGLGMGLLAQFMLILGMLDIHYSVYSIGLPMLLLLLFLLCYSIFNSKSYHKTILYADGAHCSFLDYMLISYIAFQGIFVFWHTYCVPVYEWDAIATHSFNAKILFYERSLAFHQNFPHREYPLQIPFLETWVALHLGRWDDQWIKVIFFPMFLSLITLLYYFFKSKMNRRWGLLAVAFLLSSNFLMYHASSAYREFTLAYYNTAVFLFLFFWNTDRHRGWLILAGLFSGFCSFIKLEGLGYIGMHVICLCVLLKHRKDGNFFQALKTLGGFLVLSVGIAAMYLVYKKFAFPHVPDASGLAEGASFTFHSIHLRISWESFVRMAIVFQYFFNDLFLSWNWNLIWFLIILSLAKIRQCRYSVEVRALLWSLFGFFGVYLAGFSLTQHYFWVANFQAVSRAFLHFFPLGVMLLIFLNYPSFFNLNRGD